HPLMCISCHPKEYEDWAKTKHAQAVATLNREQRMIPECLKCHSELYRRLNRVSNSFDQPGGVECATCHFGSLPHGVERKNVTTRVKVDPKICTECHTKQWSPNYEEKSYMARVSHLGVKSSESVSMPESGASKSSSAQNTHSQPTPSEQEKPTTPPPLPAGPPSLR
ncbi:MAG: cytochrome c family protein, partial [Armatimonadetes bacterium]|nr:cytochrome c family protein [Armatimonadota bacterium]